MKQPLEVVEDWILTCKISTKLTKWEKDFIESLDAQLDDEGYLTDKQIDTLERIYAEKG